MASRQTTRETFEALLDTMWNDYLDMNPDARRIHDLFVARGERVANDHIALRTFDMAPVSIDTLEATFLAVGYQERGRYEFSKKKLRARHYEPPVKGWPKIFISEVKVAELGPAAAAVVAKLVEQIDAGSVDRFDFCASGRLWHLPSGDYETLARESEYAAWVAAFGFRPNHFTVDVGSLRGLATLEQVNEMLEREGFVLNASGGKIKGTPATLLEQSSVMANRVQVQFDDGPRVVPGCYYEFARRYPGPDGALYEGFIAASADRIFESTNAR